MSSNAYIPPVLDFLRDAGFDVADNSANAIPESYVAIKDEMSIIIKVYPDMVFIKSDGPNGHVTNTVWPGDYQFISVHIKYGHLRMAGA